MTKARLPAFLVLLVFAVPASAQIYRWVDTQGRVNFSNGTPPQGVKVTIVDPNAKEGPPSMESTECYTIRCQGERMEERERKREAELEKTHAARAAAEPKRPRGLEFRKYISIQRGMSEGELVGIAGEPDLMRGGLRLLSYTYMPTVADPFTTTITLERGRVSEIERIRKF